MLRFRLTKHAVLVVAETRGTTNRINLARFAIRSTD